jgi:hypothetical protein
VLAALAVPVGALAQRYDNRRDDNRRYEDRHRDDDRWGKDRWDNGRWDNGRWDDRWNNSRNWVRLGTKRVDGRRDTDSIEVGGREKFRALMFRVSDSAARIDDVTVHFENGGPYRARLREVYAAGSRSRVLDLPGRHRDIERISFRYSDLRRGRSAEVTVYGLR